AVADGPRRLAWAARGAGRARLRRRRQPVLQPLESHPVPDAGPAGGDAAPGTPPAAPARVGLGAHRSALTPNLHTSAGAGGPFVTCQGDMSATTTPDPPDLFALLRAEVNELGHDLGHAIRTLSGEALFTHEEDIRALTKDARRNHGGPAARERLQARIAALPLDQAEGLVRAFSVYLHLANTAEERHRMRVNASRETAALQAHRPQSIPALVSWLKQEGWAADEAVALLGSLRLHLTFTAHPTETRRRTVRHPLTE